MIVVSSSHTGGHLYPGIAIQQLLPDVSCHFFLPNHNICQDISKRYNLSTSFFKLSKNIFSMTPLFLKKLNILINLKPKLLIATGGYFCATSILAAWVLRIPILLCEQNVLPGKLNRYLSIFSNQVITSFEESHKYFLFKQKLQCLGNPVRQQFVDSPISYINKLPPKGSLNILLIGGSQGAHSLNYWIERQYESCLNSKISLVHITGESYYKKEYPSECSFHFYRNKKSILIAAYGSAMDALYTWADLVISRAGASSISEILAFKCPSILIPFPYAKDKHQDHNALWMKKKGFSEVIQESDLNQVKVNNITTTKISKCKALLSEHDYKVNAQIYSKILSFIS